MDDQSTFSPVFSQNGVMIQDAVAPPYNILRPLRASDELRIPNAFPVYQKIEECLLKPAYPHPDDVIAHALAVCSGYAYSDAATLSMMMARLGLEKNRCRMISQVVQPMYIVSTAHVVQSADGRVVILAYRGTKVVDVVNWLTNVDIHPDKVSFMIGDAGPYDVHAGYYRNVRATRYKVSEALVNALNGHRVTTSLEDGEPRDDLHPAETLYLTGHSLGGAMAAVMSIMLNTDEPYRRMFEDIFEATYTYAQPMVGSELLGKACDNNKFLRENIIRYAYKKDPIPHFPPREAGHFGSFGQEYHFDKGKWQKTAVPLGQMVSLATGLTSSFIALLGRQSRFLGWVPVPYQLDDHAPHHYIRALTPPGVTTEFGDHNYTS